MARKMKCSSCEENMSRATKMYCFNGRWVCADCLIEMFAEAGADELAEIFNLDTAYAHELLSDEIPFMLSGGMYERN